MVTSKSGWVGVSVEIGLQKAKEEMRWEKGERMKLNNLSEDFDNEGSQLNPS